MSFWSRLFKSTEATEPEKKEPEAPKVELTDEEKSNLEAEIKKLNEQVKDEKFTGSESDDFNKEKADVLTKLGQDYQKLGDIDKAIESYESSLKFNEDFGPAFDALLTLYDEKRKQAAYAKNGDEIQKWLDKSDSLTALSKKIMRSK